MVDLVLDGIAIATNGYALQPASGAPRRRRRDGSGVAPAAASDDLDLLLHAADFRIAADVSLVPTADGDRRSGRRRRSSAEEPAATFSVPVGPDEGAVLLVEDDAGILSWHMPEAQVTGRRRRGGAGGTPGALTFRIAPIPIGKPAEARRRGPITEWIAEKIAEPVRVRVLRFLVSRTIDALVDHIEGGNPTGPVLLQRNLAVDQWVPGELPATLTDAEPQRVLLLIHGTFSSTAGSFGALAGHPLFDRLFDHYDLIIGYDHKTLGEDPVSNAEAILAMLHGLDLPGDCVFDAIAYSRGGLILRLLCEELLPESGLSIAIERAVFVGCTNSGTLLAEPDNWEDLVNIYTNVIVAATKAVGWIAGGVAAAATPWAAYAIKTIGRFVQMLPQVAISERRLPGLAAMEPDGDLVLRLNAARPAPGFATRYHAITSEYEPGEDGGLGKRAALFLADRALDRLLGEANDLVVHTASMTAFGKGREAEKVHALGASGHVFHTIYFASPAAMEPLFDWLDVGDDETLKSAPAAHPAPRHRRSAPSSRGAPSGRGGMAGVAGGSARRSRSRNPSTGVGIEAAPPPPSPSPAEAQFAGEEDALIPESTSAGPRAPKEPEAAIVDRHIAAEMEPMPQLDRMANIYVTVSPNEIVVGDHEAAATTAVPAQVLRDRPILLSVIPRSNCEVIGRDNCEVASDVEDEVISKFRLKGLGAGPAEVLIEARQGARTLASFLLRPMFVTEEPLREVQSGIAPADADLESAVLRIYEFRANGTTTLRFDLSSDGPDIARLDTVTLDDRFDIGRFAAETLKDVEAAWDLRSKTGEEDIYDSFLRGLRNRARNRTASLIPEPIRRCLWENREQIKTIQIISEEAYIPWELMYLSDPDGQKKDGEGFFAERGLIRWLHNAPLRKRPPVLDGATSRYVIPPYKDEANILPSAEDEKAMLEKRLPGIQPLKTTSNAVRQFLSEEAHECTLLHFACHGETEQRSLVNSCLLMTEHVHADESLIPDPLHWEDVKEELDFGEGRAPIVFINACQTGQGGIGIAGTAGFADAFIRPRSKRGASIFIGALWSVDDLLATHFADKFYEMLAAKAPLVDAVHAARKACQDKSDFSWLAYSVYCAV